MQNNRQAHGEKHATKGFATQYTKTYHAQERDAIYGMQTCIAVLKNQKRYAMGPVCARIRKDMLQVSGLHGTHVSASHGTHLSASHGTHVSASHDTHVSASHGTHVSASHDTHVSASHGTHVSALHGTHVSASHDTHLSASHGTHVSASHDTHVYGYDTHAWREADLYVHQTSARDSLVVFYKAVVYKTLIEAANV